MRLDGKTALVTGAARGIGRAIAETLCSLGAQVAVADIREAPVVALAQELEADGRTALPLTVDVTRGAAIDEMVARTVAELGRIDAFFNNAGIIEVEAFLDADEAHWNRIMDVNAKGVFLCGQAVARQMIEQGGGRIVNTASMAAHMGIPDMTAYAASKAVVVSLTRSMALALAPHGITVNALAPGIVATDMWGLIDERRGALRGQAPGEPTRERVEQIPLGRAATAQDIAEVAAFLVSDGSAYVTGQTIGIDGGVRPS